MSPAAPDGPTPSTAPLPVVAEPAGSSPADAAPPAPAGWTSAMRTLDAGLVVGTRACSRRALARRLGIPLAVVRTLARALGYPDAPDDAAAFSEEDAGAFAAVTGLVQDGVLNEETAFSLARSIGQLTDRMVVWQIEALVEEKMSSEGLSDPAARRAAVDLLPEIIAPVEEAMRVVYRRQLNSAVQRLTVRVEAGLAASERGRTGEEDDAPLPLARAVGFADMVAYTTLSRTMGERALARTVQRFESTAAEIIATGGGWLVKTIGDEVLFNAETPEAGAEIALKLSDAMAADDQLPSARVSLAWGRVLSRLGDIYGPTVNLAARLTSLADPGTVLVDAMTAAALSQDERFVLVPQPPRIVRGFGEVRPSLLMHGSAASPIDD